MLLVEPSTTEYLTMCLSAYGTGGLTGQTVTVAIRRCSDGYYLDWNDGTYKASGWTTKQGSLTEIGGGTYQRAWSVGALSAGAQYVAEFTCSGVTAQAVPIKIVASVSNVPGAVWDETASSHVTAGSLGELLSKLRKIHTNRVVETAGNPGTVVVYDDDGTTPYLTYQVTDSSGGAVTAQTGAPARRTAAT